MRYKQWEAFTLIPPTPSVPRDYVPFLIAVSEGDLTIFAYADKSSGGKFWPTLRPTLWPTLRPTLRPTLWPTLWPTLRPTLWVVM